MLKIFYFINKSVKCILNRMTCKQASKQPTNQPSAEELDYRGATAPKNGYE